MSKTLTAPVFGGIYRYATQKRIFGVHHKSGKAAKDVVISK